MVLVLAPEDLEPLSEFLREAGEPFFPIGHVVPREGRQEPGVRWTAGKG